MKLLIVQNYWTPYRHHLFTRLAEHPDIELEVLYLGEVGSDRKWQFRQADFPMLRPKSFRFGPFVFTDISKVPVESYDTIILLEHLENIFTILRLAARAKGNYLLWSGMFDNMYPDKPAYGRVVSLFKRLYRPFLYRARHYLAYSSLSRQMLEGEGIPSSMITVMPQVALVGEQNTPPEPELKELRQARQEAGGPLQILSLGYLRPEKNNLSLARVCGRFSPDQLHLTIVGDGPEKEALDHLKGDNVTILDYLDGPEKFARYLASDLFVLPTLRDPWALVVNEAMYCGLPVLCSDRAGAKDAIDGNGFVYDPHDEEALYRHLDFFVKNRDQVAVMGSRSREIIRAGYSAEHAVEILAALLVSITGRKDDEDSRRILFINDYAEGGGAEVVMRQLRAGLEAADPPWKVRLFCAYHKNRSKSGFPLSYIYSRRYRKRLAGVLKEFRPEIIHLLNYYHVLSPSVLDALKRYKRKNPSSKVIHTAHDFHLVCPNSGLTSFDRAGKIRREEPVRPSPGPSGWKLYLTRWDHRGWLHSFLKLTQWVWAYRWHHKEQVLDKVICPGGFMYDAMVPLFGPSRVELVRNPYLPTASPASQPAAGARILSPEEPLRLVFIGRLGQEKGLLPFLSHLPSELWPSIQMDIFGEGPEEAAIRAYISEHKLQEGCRLHGKSGHADILKQLRDYHALILPSIWYENAPLSLVEGAFAGLRLIASGWGGVGQLARFCGDAVLIDPCDTPSIGTALEQVRNDFEAGTPLERNLTDLGQAFSYERFIRDHIRLYTDKEGSISDAPRNALQ